MTTLPIVVRTFVSGSEDVEFERVIDHSRHNDRVWLSKHCYWAVRNGRDVEIENLVEA